MRLRRLGFIAAAVLALLPAAARADLLISIDKSAQRMTVTVDGDALYIWPVSTGRPGYDTPNGAYSPFRMERQHFSREWDDAPMPYSIFFTQHGHAIHGTNHRITGMPASHGCVRLSVRNAAMLWDLVKEQGKANTMVVLTGKIPARAAPLVAGRDNGGDQVMAEEDDADITASAPPRGWRRYDYGDRPRYYYYRTRPYYPRRYYRYGGYPFFPYGR